jgi:hypothetical protein
MVELELEFERVFIVCDFNFCGPELTAEYCRNYRLYGISEKIKLLYIIIKGNETKEKTKIYINRTRLI